MYYWENLGVAWTQIKSSKLRSILTTLGITIGIATVIFIVAILEGYTLSITKELNMLGANVFQLEKYDRDSGIQVGHRHRERRKNLIREYSQEIRERCDAVKFVGAEVWYYNISFRYKDKKTNPTYIATTIKADNKKLAPSTMKFLCQSIKVVTSPLIKLVFSIFGARHLLEFITTFSLTSIFFVSPDELAIGSPVSGFLAT